MRKRNGIFRQLEFRTMRVILKKKREVEKNKDKKRKRQTIEEENIEAAKKFSVQDEVDQ